MNRNGMTSLEVTLGAEGQFLESPLQGNLHGGFGGGVRKHSAAVRLAPTLLMQAAKTPGLAEEVRGEYTKVRHEAH